MLVSTSSPSVSGRSVTLVKYRMVCGWPSCCSLKSSLVRLLTMFPCLSRTVASTLTTLTSEEKVGTSWAGRLLRQIAAESARRIGVPNLINKRPGSCGIDRDFSISNRVYLTSRQAGLRRGIAFSLTRIEFDYIQVTRQRMRSCLIARRQKFWNLRGAGDE